MIKLTLKEKIGIGIVLMMHVVGIVGLNFSTFGEDFANLTPINLLVTLAVISYFHRQFNFHFLLFFLSAFSIGMFVEIIGVQTGQIFGAYEYSTILGPQILGVPIMIGFNWFLLLYTIGAMLQSFSFSKNILAVTGAFLMMLIDIVIEPFAIRFNLWEWTGVQHGSVPFQNYVAWFVISFFLFKLYYLFNFDKNNKVAGFTFIILFIFFLLNFVINYLFY